MSVTHSRIDPKKVLAGAIIFPWEQRNRIAKALAVPVGIYVALNATLFLNTGAPLAFFVGLLDLAIQTYIAVTIHRMILLNDSSAAEWGLRRWTKRETVFLVHVVLVGLCSAPAMVFMLFSTVGLFLGLCVAAWIVARLSLVFPAIAIDEWVSIQGAWRLTKDHQVLMLMTVIVFPIAISIPVILVAYLPYSWLFEVLLDTVLTVLVVAALSLSYREIRRADYGA